MIIPAAVAKLNQYTDQHFQNVIDQLKASQDEGVSDFELDVQLLDEDEISDLVMALDVSGYTAVFNQDAFTIEIQYE
jgi:molybdenum cofactor biosynthesis enzyme MoaA